SDVCSSDLLFLKTVQVFPHHFLPFQPKYRKIKLSAECNGKIPETKGAVQSKHFPKNPAAEIKRTAVLNHVIRPQSMVLPLIDQRSLPRVQDKFVLRMKNKPFYDGFL